MMSVDAAARETAQFARPLYSHQSHGTLAVQPVIPRRLFSSLVIGVPIGAIVLTLLLASSALAHQLADAALARGLLIAAVATAAALLVNVLLLVTALGIQALGDE